MMKKMLITACSILALTAAIPSFGFSILNNSTSNVKLWNMVACIEGAKNDKCKNWDNAIMVASNVYLYVWSNNAEYSSFLRPLVIPPKLHNNYTNAMEYFPYVQFVYKDITYFVTNEGCEITIEQEGVLNANTECNLQKV